MEENIYRKKDIATLWFVWEFYEAPRFLLQVWNNYMLFALNFFSFSQLIKTFFAPWRRYKWAYPRGFDIKEFFNTLISNTVSRILGALMRVVLIIMGTLFQIFVAIAGLVIFIGWLLVPFVMVAGVLFVFLF